MNVSSIFPCRNLYFGSNSGEYRANNGNVISTYTNLYRGDLEWSRFTTFMQKHFKDKENVKVLQFASSDGSEAYTFLISLLEKQQVGANKFYPIEAYDVDKVISDVAQSKFINLNDNDKSKLRDRNIDFDKYFKKTAVKISIPNDKLKDSAFEDNKTSTYKVSDDLTSKVNFHNGDMFDVLRNYKDNSGTVLLCRNVLDYLSNRDIDDFTTLASCKLKKGSLLVIGEIDGDRVTRSIESKGFVRVMSNVYMLA